MTSSNAVTPAIVIYTQTHQREEDSKLRAFGDRY